MNLRDRSPRETCVVKHAVVWECWFPDPSITDVWRGGGRGGGRIKPHRDGEFLLEPSFILLEYLKPHGTGGRKNVTDFAKFSTCGHASFNYVRSLPLLPIRFFQGETEYGCLFRLRCERCAASPLGFPRVVLVDCSVYVTRYMPRIKDPSTPWGVADSFVQPSKCEAVILQSGVLNRLSEVPSLLLSLGGGGLKFIQRVECSYQFYNSACAAPLGVEGLLRVTDEEGRFGIHDCKTCKSESGREKGNATEHRWPTELLSVMMMMMIEWRRWLKWT